MAYLNATLVISSIATEREYIASCVSKTRSLHGCHRVLDERDVKGESKEPVAVH